jgi:hypothetical protein
MCTIAWPKQIWPKLQWMTQQLKVGKFIRLSFYLLFRKPLVLSFDFLYFRDYSFKDRGKITLLLSARFRCLFIAIKRKRLLLHYTFNGNLIKLRYNYRHSNANRNYGVNV